MWFCYELSDAGKWEACAYRTNFGEPALDDRLRTELVELPEDCIGGDGEPMFGKLRERFPLGVTDG